MSSLSDLFIPEFGPDVKDKEVLVSLTEKTGLQDKKLYEEITHFLPKVSYFDYHACEEEVKRIMSETENENDILFLGI